MYQLVEISTFVSRPSGHWLHQSGLSDAEWKRFFQYFLQCYWKSITNYKMVEDGESCSCWWKDDGAKSTTEKQWNLHLSCKQRYRSVTDGLCWSYSKWWVLDVLNTFRTLVRIIVKKITIIIVSLYTFRCNLFF